MVYNFIKVSDGCTLEVKESDTVKADFTLRAKSVLIESGATFRVGYSNTKFGAKTGSRFTLALWGDYIVEEAGITCSDPTCDVPPDTLWVMSWCAS